MRFYLIGKDIALSPSPRIHYQIFSFLGVEAEYGLMQADNLSAFRQGLGGLADGYNVTAPFKSEIINYIDEDCSECGSVNTLRVKDGAVKGYSTDGRGFILDAKRLKLDLSRVLVVGYGGASKSIIHELNKVGSRINVYSRHGGGAKGLNGFSGRPTLCLNCSGLDCGAEGDVYDLRYRNFQKGAHGGLGMLIYQAILSDEIFFDRRIDLGLFEPIYNDERGRL